MKRKESYAVPDGQPAARKDVESRLTSVGTSMHSRVVARSAILIPEVTRQASNSADRRGRSHEARVTRDDEQNLFDLLRLNHYKFRPVPALDMVLKSSA